SQTDVKTRIERACFADATASGDFGSIAFDSPAGFVPSGEGFAPSGAGAGAGPGAGAPPVTACGARGSGRPLAGGAAAGTRAPELVPTGGRAAGAGAGGIAPPL